MERRHPAGAKQVSTSGRRANQPGPPRPRRLEGDNGATLLLSLAIMMSVLFLATLVADLGLARAVRQSNQRTADLAALAGGDKLSQVDGIDPIGACYDVVTFLRHNASGISADVSLPCDVLPAECDTLQPPTTIDDGGTATPYSIELTYPVPESMIADAAVSGARLHDGHRCERMRIVVDRRVPTMFASIFGTESMNIRATAVVRRQLAERIQTPNLWLLDPTGCTLLSVQGGSNVTVGEATLPGQITLDSDGSTCSNNAYTIDAGGSGSRVRATPLSGELTGTIALYAMAKNQTTCSTGNLRACDPADITAGMVQPQPIRRRYRATRAPVDHEFNCRSSYPQYHGIKLLPCDDAASRPPYIDQLRAGVGTSGPISGFNRWSSYYGCTNPIVPPAIAGNWWIDCTDLKLSSGSNINFTGGNIVIENDVSLSGGSLSFNTSNVSSTLSATCRVQITGCLTSSSADAAWIYFRNGSLKMTGGNFTVKRGTVYMHKGYFQMSGGSPPVWSAPTDGPFNGLALWAEAPSSNFRINGGAAMELDGVFFTPEANSFQISGGSPVKPQRAQFISYRLTVTGGGSLVLTPDESRFVRLPPPAPELIR